MAPPLALGVLAACTPAHHRLTVCDENVERWNRRDTPDLVGLSVKVDTFPRACEIAAHYRQRGTTVVMGGIHATVRPEDCLRHADAVVIGEGDKQWPLLLNDQENGRLQRIYRDPIGTARPTPPAPRLDIFRGGRYLFTNTLVAGRGCPWRCDFCYNSSPNVDARHRLYELDHILAQVDALNTRHVMFIDDNFIGDVPRARQLARSLGERQLTWHCAVSADVARHGHLLEFMAQAGCKSLFIGFESINQESLGACRKAQNRIAEYDETIARVHRAGMLVNASMVFGFDHDDASVFETTRAWLESNRVETMTAHILTPYPGTTLHERLEKQGRIVDRDLTHYNTAHAVFRPALMTADELERGYLRIYRDFYSWRSIARRMPLDPAQRLPYLLFSLAYRKYGKPLSPLGRLVGMRRLARLAKWLSYDAVALRNVLCANSPRVVMARGPRHRTHEVDPT